MFDFGYAFSIILVLCIGIVCILGTVKMFCMVCDYIDVIQRKKIGEHDRFETLRSYAASKLKNKAWNKYSREWYAVIPDSVLDLLVGNPVYFPGGSEGYQKKMDRLYEMLTK